MDFEIGLSAYCRRCGSKEAIFVIKVLITSYHKIDRDTLLSEREGYTSYQTLFSTYLCKKCCEETTYSFENWINDYQVNFLIANVPIEQTNLMIGICLDDQISKKSLIKKKQKQGSQIRQTINRKAQRYSAQQVNFNNSSRLSLVLQPNSSNSFGSTNRDIRVNKIKPNNNHDDPEKNFVGNVNWNNRINNMINTNNSNRSFNNYLSNIIKEKQKSRNKLSHFTRNTNLPFLENSRNFQEKKQEIQNAIIYSGDSIVNDVLVNQQYFKKLNANKKDKIQENYYEYFKNKKIACDKIQKIIKNFESQGSLFENPWIKNNYKKLFFDFLSPKTFMIQMENQNKELNRFYEKNKKEKRKTDLNLAKRKEVERVNKRPKMKMKVENAREKKRKEKRGKHEGRGEDRDKGKDRRRDKKRERDKINKRHKNRHKSRIRNKDKINHNNKNKDNCEENKGSKKPLKNKSKINNGNILHQNYSQNKSTKKNHHDSTKNNGRRRKESGDKIGNGYHKHTQDKAKSIRKRKFGNSSSHQDHDFTNEIESKRYKKVDRNSKKKAFPDQNYKKDNQSQYYYQKKKSFKKKGSRKRKFNKKKYD
ncbi:hypothetical protein M0813_24287 [Anaeramoeba flamelloides]|uniref:Uncharacterized protein n=1 Tax=Anaeramoeba flamelloides TaxID=1746091 RepID=A0ABQ8Y7M1_9EUKA|nr:hypothetical protein M0813_24287 [Anaeramoeba flamelloides]